MAARRIFGDNFHTNGDEQAVFNDTQSAMLAVNGLHKLMWTGDLSSSAFYGGYDMLMIWYEVMGDDLVYTYSNAQFQKQAQWSSHRNATIGSATHFIACCNILSLTVV